MMKPKAARLTAEMEDLLSNRWVVILHHEEHEGVECGVGVPPERAYPDPEVLIGIALNRFC